MVVHFGRFLTLDPKCTGTFWASSTERLTFGTKCTGTFWMVSMGLQLTCFTFDPKCTGTFWTVSPFDTKCTGTFWRVLPFDTKCTGTFWAVSTVLWLACLAFECECSRTTPHQWPTNAKFDNKPLMKKGQNKRKGTILLMRMIMAIHWGSPAHDSNPQFFGSTGGTQFSTIYSIQYGCLGRQDTQIGVPAF